MVSTTTRKILLAEWDILTAKFYLASPKCCGCKVFRQTLANSGGNFDYDSKRQSSKYAIMLIRMLLIPARYLNTQDQCRACKSLYGGY